MITDELVMDSKVFYLLLSVMLSVGLFVGIKLFIRTKLNELQGAQKLLGLSLIVIAIGESIYLGTVFGLFKLAIEFIAYLGIGLWLFLIPFQTSLKNIISGIGNFMNIEMNVGDLVEVKGKRGVIIEMHLSKTVLMTENGERINVPNHRFSEDVTVVLPKQKRFKNEDILKYV